MLCIQVLGVIFRYAESELPEQPEGVIYVYAQIRLCNVWKARLAICERSRKIAVYNFLHQASPLYDVRWEIVTKKPMRVLIRLYECDSDKKMWTSYIWMVPHIPRGLVYI